MFFRNLKNIWFELSILPDDIYYGINEKIVSETKLKYFIESNWNFSTDILTNNTNSKDFLEMKFEDIFDYDDFDGNTDLEVESELRTESSIHLSYSGNFQYSNDDLLELGSSYGLFVDSEYMC